MAQLESLPASARQGPEPAALLATKFAIPQVPGSLVPRARLLAALQEGVARQLVVVSTPAGFGKTTLLATWAKEAGLPVAWLSLDRDDSDPARFWRYLAAAIDHAHRGGAARVQAMLTGPTRPSSEAIATELLNEAAMLPGEVVLVLDDYHTITSDQVHREFGFFVARLPAQLRVVVASRADPPLPLARLRGRGQLAELRAADLRFTAEETATFLQVVWGLSLDPETIAALEERTEGWAAGLQLAALSLRRCPDPAGFVRDFTGTHRFILDYLAEEVLEGQPERLRRFLLETSVLERLCAPLCDAVTGRADAQRLLAEVERANLFLVPLDQERRWYRYHHLFADLLRARLRQQEPDREPELHRRAALWCEHHGLVDDAVRHALGAGDGEWSARLVERHVEELLIGRGERATMDRWLSALPEEVVRSHPRLSLIRAISAVMAGRLEEADLLLAAADTAPDNREDRHEPSIGRGASILANVAAATAATRAELARLRGDASGERAFAAEAQTHLTADDRVLAGEPGYHLAMAAWLDGRVEEAERGLAGVIAARQAAGETYLALRAAYDLGQVQRAAGRLRAAMGTHRRALDAAAPAGGPPSVAAGMALVGMAEVLLQRGHLAEALDHATEGVRLCRHLAYATPLAAGLATLAWTRHTMGDRAGAWQAIAEAERAVPDPGVASLLNPAIPTRARLLLAHGDLAGARRWVEAQGLGEEDEPDYPREPEYLVLARLLLAHRAADRVLRLLAPVAAAGQEQGRLGSLIEARALQALALQATGDPDQALTALTEALRLGWPEGYVRVFADEGPPMAALLRRLVAARRRGDAPADPAVPIDYLARILAAFEHRGQPRLGDDGAVVAGLVEPLTDRELEVLRLLAEGRRNQEIANELVVTLHTVKKHLSHILRKLGASNRAQAIAHARQLGVIR
jgi:LuxR family transcriptional regulator, maltose regulon positive regulatory protein